MEPRRTLASQPWGRTLATASLRQPEKSNGKLYWYSTGGQILEETDLSGNLLNDYILVGGMRFARRDASGNVYYYLTDALGTTRGMLLNSNTTLCYDADFYPFGGEKVFTNTCAQNYKFTGLERDAESGLDNTVNRMYTSNLGRWLSPDPLAGDITNPQSLNRYGYVTNNPTSFVDPKGLHLRNPGDWNDTGCTLDGFAVWCGSLGVGGGGGGNGVMDVTGTDTTPRYNSKTDQWSFFGCYADGSCGFVPSSLTGNSPQEIFNQLAIVKQGQAAVNNGTLIDSSKLTGNAALAYNLLKQAGVPEAGIQIYQTDDGKISIVLSPGAFNTLQNVLQPGYGATFLHPPYGEGGRLTVVPGRLGTLHVVWVPGNIAAYFGGDGSGYAQAHVDITNPANNLLRHLCETFGLCH